MAAGAIVEDGSWLDRLQGELRGLLAPVFAQARSLLAAEGIGAIGGGAVTPRDCGKTVPARLLDMLAFQLLLRHSPGSPVRSGPPLVIMSRIVRFPDSHAGCRGSGSIPARSGGLAPLVWQVLSLLPASMIMGAWSQYAL